MTTPPKKPMGREHGGDYFVESIADAVADRLQNIQGRRKRLFDIDEAAVYLSMSEEAIRDLVSAGKLRTVRPTRKIQFDIIDMDNLIDSIKSA